MSRCAASALKWRHSAPRSTTGARRRDNTYGTLHEDALRRDFIANCIYYDPHTGEVHVHERTLKDLRARRLSMLGDPHQRFIEDPVRMLRAVRFATRLNLKMDDEMRATIIELAELLLRESPARLYGELEKLFHAGVAVAAYKSLRELGLFGVLFPLAESHLPPRDDDTRYEDFLYALLTNTDQRYDSGKPVVSAFLLAGFLWAEIEENAMSALAHGASAYKAFNDACSRAIAEQTQIVAVQRHTAMMVREICRMQREFNSKRAKVLRSLDRERKFRAAYDFMCLRSQVGLEEPALCDFWTDFQTADDSRRRQMVDERVHSLRHA